MDDRRSQENARREEDRRWLKVQGEIMNLVTSQRTSQQVLAKMEIELGKLGDHVDEVDDHLRGVGGHDSLDTRIAVMEREVHSHGVILRKISSQLDGIKEDFGELKSDVSSIKIHRALSKETDSTKFAKFKEWLKFFGPIVIACIALAVPLATLVVTHWDTIEKRWNKKSEDPVRKMINKTKHPRKKIYVTRVRTIPAKRRELLTPTTSPLDLVP